MFMSITTSWTDAESTDRVRGLFRVTGAPLETWLQAEAGTPLGRSQERMVIAWDKMRREPVPFPCRVWMCYRRLSSA